MVFKPWKVQQNTMFAENNNVGSNNLKMVLGSFYIPKDKPDKPQGQDAHFLLPELQTFGLADGVGGCKKRGIDSGVYSRELMSNAVLSIRKQNPGKPVDPKTVLEQAFSESLAEGSSTALIGTLNGDSLRAVNVGDSGFVHIRRGKVIYKSRFQQHGFNCPYQLKKGSNEIRLAEEIERDLEYGDVIVAGTDGLFDNVHDEELDVEVKRGLEGLDVPEDLAWKIAEFALRQSENPDVVSPFAVRSFTAGRGHRTGGKRDDITVIVAYVTFSQM